MIRRLRVKFIVINMTFVTTMLCIILGLVYHFTRINLETSSLHMMQNIALNPTTLNTPYDFSPDVRLPFFTLQVNAQGELLSTGGGYYDLSNQEFLRELVALSYRQSESTGLIPEYNLRFSRITTPTAQYMVFADISSEINTLDSLFRSSVMIGIAGFFLFFMISILLSHWAVRPVEQAWIQQKQFVSDASHELKTPLTIILTNAEMLQSTDYDVNAHQQFSDNILSMAHQMRGLVENLLDLARMDNGSFNFPAELLPLSQHVNDSALLFEPVFFEKDLTLSWQIDEDIHIKANSIHIDQLLSILLDNARKYSYPQTESSILLKRLSKKYCMLSVTSHGDPIPPKEQKNIFKRFYRMDKARSMEHSYGLGLSIAENIIQKYKGKVWCESMDGRNTFFVLLPMHNTSRHTWHFPIHPHRSDH